MQPPQASTAFENRIEPDGHNNSRAADSSVTAWVFFSDKGRLADERLSRMRINPDMFLSERALWRRQRQQVQKSIDMHDLAPAADYVGVVSQLTRRVRHVSNWLNAVSVEATQAQLRHIARLKFVSHLAPVATFTKQRKLSQAPSFAESRHDAIATNSELDYGPSFGQIVRMNVPPLHDIGLTGAGILICVMDVGFDYKQHEALRPARVLYERDFLEGDEDTNGQSASHGTEVLAVCAAFKPGQLIGSAYGADFMVARTEDAGAEFLGEEDLWVAALEWADSLGADIVSSSLANFGLHTYAELDGQTSIASRAASHAAARGILVCNAIGNNGSRPATLVSPADADSILAVGSVNAAGQLSAFSSRGPTADGRIKPEVLAVGELVYTVRFNSVDGYQRINGTSYATPLTAGIAALVWQNHPYWGPLQVREALINTASNADAPNNDLGWGLVDAVQAAFYKSIGGAITDAVTAASVTGAEVAYSGPTAGTLQNDSSGRFLIEGLVPGEYVLTVTATGYEPASARFQVAPWIGDANFALNPIASDVRPTAIASDFQLHPNYPNPFNPHTTIRFRLARTTAVRLAVYNLAGERIKMLVDGTLAAGEHRTIWDGRTQTSTPAASGLYVYKLEAGEFRGSGKMLLVR